MCVYRGSVILNSRNVTHLDQVLTSRCVWTLGLIMTFALWCFSILMYLLRLILNSFALMYQGIYALLFLKCRRARSIGFRLAVHAGKLRYFFYINATLQSQGLFRLVKLSKLAATATKNRLHGSIGYNFLFLYVEKHQN